MHSLLLIPFLPFAAAVPLGNVYKAILHPYERDIPATTTEEEFIFPTGTTVPVATETFERITRTSSLPLVTGTVSAPIVSGTASGFPIQTPQFPCELKVGYGLAPRSIIPEPEHNIMNILPRHEGHDDEFATLPRLRPTGTAGRSISRMPFPGATGFPRPPNGSPCFPSVRPSGRPAGRPSGRPTGAPSVPRPTGAVPSAPAMPSFTFPDGEPSTPEPTGLTPIFD